MRRGQGPDPRFKLGVFVYEDAELLDFAGPCGVFSLAARFNPRLEVALIAERAGPVAVRPGFSVLAPCGLQDAVELDALLLPGGPGARREMNNPRLSAFVSGLPQRTLLASVCSGALILGRMGLLDDRIATSRNEPDPESFSFARSTFLDELARVAPRAELRAVRLVDTGRVITSAGSAAGLDLAFHLLRRAGHDEAFVSEVARVMDYTLCYETHLADALAAP